MKDRKFEEQRNHSPNPQNTAVTSNPSTTPVSTTPTTLSRLGERMLQPVDVAVLVYFRIAFGGLIVFAFLFHLIRYLNTPDLQRSTLYYPEFTFSYLGFDWVRLWPPGHAELLFLALVILGLLMMLGLCYRVTAILLCLVLTYAFLLEKAHFFSHTYLICLHSFLLIFVPAHRTFSLDSLWRPKLHCQVAPAWTLWLLRSQIAIVYFHSGLAKLNSDWLAGEPMHLWLGDDTRFSFLFPFISAERFPNVFVYGGVFFDLLIVPALIWPRTRIPAICIMTAFHLSNAYLFIVGFFPLIALIATLLYLPPNWPRQFFGTIFLPAKTRRQAGVEPKVKFLAPPLAIRCIVGIFLLWQFFFPLRHHLYTGNPQWTEEGQFFAWRMMTRDKRGQTSFLVTEPETGKRWLINPANPQYNDYFSSPMDAHTLGQDDDRKRKFIAFLEEQFPKSNPWLREHGYQQVAVQSQDNAVHFTIRDPQSGKSWPEISLDYLANWQAHHMAAHPDLILQFSHYLAERVCKDRGLDRVEVYAESWISLNGRPLQPLIDPQIDLAAQPRSLRHAEWILPLTVELEK